MKKGIRCALAIGLTALHLSASAAEAVGTKPSDGTSAGKPPLAAASIPCLEPAQLRNDMTPVVLNQVLASCINQNQQDNAVFAFALGGAYGYFDTLRVADETARQAVKVIRMVTMGSLAKDWLQAFQDHLNAVMGDRTQRRSVCATVRGYGPPAYYPKYMVDHGMAAMKAAMSGTTLAARGLVENFDEAKSWNVAVNSYLLCEGS